MLRQTGCVERGGANVLSLSGSHLGRIPWKHNNNSIDSDDSNFLSTQH